MSRTEEVDMKKIWNAYLDWASEDALLGLFLMFCALFVFVFLFINPAVSVVSLAVLFIVCVAIGMSPH